MKAKEIAEHVGSLLGKRKDLTDEETDEILKGAELLARHVLAQEMDSELYTPVETAKVLQMAKQHQRYLLILEQVDASDPAAREFLEAQLDQIAATRAAGHVGVLQ